MSTADGVIMFGVWGVVIWAMWRQFDRPSTRSRTTILTLIFACGCVFSLRHWAVQTELDAVYGGQLPIGGTVRMLAMLVAATGYWKLLQTLPSPYFIPPITQRLAPLLSGLPWLAIAGMLAALFACAHGYLSYFQTYFLNQLWGDLAISGLILGAFFPINWRLITLEKPSVLRLKYQANLLLCSCYLLAFLLSLPLSLTNILGGAEQAPRQYLVLAIGGAVGVSLQILPFKALNWLFLPQQYQTYWQLYRLEKVAAQASRGVSYGQRWVRPARLSQHRHILLINLLDHQVHLPRTPEHDYLHQQMAYWVDNDPYLQARQQEAHEQSSQKS